MIIDNLNSIKMINAMRFTDEWNRPFYKVRAYVLQEFDLNSFRNKQDAQNYLDQITEEIASKGADHIVIVSEL